MKAAACKPKGASTVSVSMAAVLCRRAACFGGGDDDDYDQEAGGKGESERKYKKVSPSSSTIGLTLHSNKIV